MFYQEDRLTKPEETGTERKEEGRECKNRKQKLGLTPSTFQETFPRFWGKPG